MAEYLLSIGSNCPSAPAMMQRAEEWMRTEFTVIASSGIYTSKALNPALPDYLNMVAKIESALDASELTALGKDFERTCGRTPQSKQHGCIEMDIDVIQADNVILRPTEFTRPYFLHGLTLLHPL